MARGIPADVIDGINSGIFELYGGVIHDAAGNDAADRNIPSGSWPSSSRLGSRYAKWPRG